MISLEAVSFTYPDGTRGVKEISFSIPRGALFLLCGMNGSGKSTVLKLIAGLYKPSSGKVLVDGANLWENSTARRSVGLVFQNPDHQILGETVEDDVLLGLLYRGVPPSEAKRRTAEVLERCNLGHLATRNCHFLSGGEKKRLAIASVVVLQPRCILMDEPFAGLDFPAVQAVLRQILEMKTEGYTIVLSSHEVETVAPHIDGLAVIHGGRITLSSSTNPSDIFPLLSTYGVKPPCYTIFGTPPLSWLSL